MQSNNDLIKGVKNGDQEAFKILYSRYADLLYAFILYQLDKNREAASDIWQETWMSFIEKINSFQHKSNVFTWLCAISKNKIIDFYRLSKTQREFKNNLSYQFDIDKEEIKTEFIDNKTQSDVITILATLSDEHRKLLMLRYFENKSVNEISVEIGKSYKATESNLSRAREAFRKKFTDINKQ